MAAFTASDMVAATIRKELGMYVWEIDPNEYEIELPDSLEAENTFRAYMSVEYPHVIMSHPMLDDEFTLHIADAEFCDKFRKALPRYMKPVLPIGQLV